LATNDDDALDRILNLEQVVHLVGLSETTVWREVKAGRFPAPLIISPRRRGWRLSALLAWLASRPSPP
jgi:prophage regulatory protein